MLLGAFRKVDRRINLFALAFRGSLVFALLQFYCASLWARPTTTHQAKRVVAGWLRTEMQPLGTALGQKIIKVETFSNVDGEHIYYVVYLQPSGFVILSADDLVEPIIAFADDGFFDPSLDNPLGALVSQDINGRVAAVREAQSVRGIVLYGTAPSPQAKWNQLESLAEARASGPVMMDLSTISDVRVAPLVKSKWDQRKVCGNYCYNYYTPNHYPSGCSATALAQILRFHKYPTTAIGVHAFTIGVDGAFQTAYTRGGNGSGGKYNWNLMELVPDCTTTLEQRQAIGALCYDVGVVLNTEYWSFGSSVSEADMDSIGSVFNLSNGIFGENGGGNIGAGLNGMVNPNLDANHPVALAIWEIGQAYGHAILADGYGYNLSTLYHHLNMGWSGTDDAWYNLPNVDATNSSYDCINVCFYNIYTSGSGEIISGRVTDSAGSAISGAAVTAQRTGSGTYPALTNSKGIYALSKIPSASTYTVSVTKTGYDFTNETVTTGTSVDMENTSGNRWGIDFVGNAATHHPADTDSDYVISISEIVSYINKWAIGEVTISNVVKAINLWAAGHYYWDEDEQKFKPGEEP